MRARGRPPLDSLWADRLDLLVWVFIYAAKCSFVVSPYGTLVRSLAEWSLIIYVILAIVSFSLLHGFDHTNASLCELAGLIMGLAQHAQRPDLQEVFEIS